jgi:hypothetical protein
MCLFPCAAFFAKLNDKYFQEGEVTGLLLCYPNCIVHLLEVGAEQHSPDVYGWAWGCWAGGWPYLISGATCYSHNTCGHAPCLQGKTSILMSILRDILAAGPAEHRLSEARVGAHVPVQVQCSKLPPSQLDL